MVKKLKHAVSNGDPTNDWKRVIVAAISFATLCVSAWSNNKISSVQTEARTAAKAAKEAVELARDSVPEPTPKARKEVQF